MHVEHVHPLLAAGAAMPAAAQLKPPVGTAGGVGALTGAEGVEDFAAPGLSASQMVHFEVAVEGLLSPQTEQSQLSAGFEGALSPAASQLKPDVGGAGATTGGEGDEVAGVDAPGLAASQTVHFDVAVEGLLSPQTGQPQLSAGFVGTFSPAAPQLNPIAGGAGTDTGGDGEEVVAGVDAPGLSASQTVHFEIAVGGC